MVLQSKSHVKSVHIIRICENLLQHKQNKVFAHRQNITQPKRMRRTSSYQLSALMARQKKRVLTHKNFLQDTRTLEFLQKIEPNNFWRVLLRSSLAFYTYEHIFFQRFTMNVAKHTPISI